MNQQCLAVLLMLIVVPLAGELKFFPFEGEFSAFRVSFGAPVFLFFLLWLHRLSFLSLGLSAGAAVLLFRMLLDAVTGTAVFSASFQLHVPAFFYYVSYAVIFYFAKAHNLYDQPLRIGVLSICAEITASLAELLIYHWDAHSAITLDWNMLVKLLVTAVIRSFFALSFFFIMKLRHAEFIAEQQREQNQHMMLLISSLYQEGIHLSKTLQNAESITRDCYNLYKDLQNSQAPFQKNQLAQSILGIAGQVHEIKKDNQRIYASLSQLISDGKLHEYLPVEELTELIIQSHQKYARSLHKTITFETTLTATLPKLAVYTILSLVNNLVANAVESIQETGTIRLSVDCEQGDVVFRVADNGPGIAPKKQNLIFKPGYTTKFDAAGNPSTGMGLPYIKELAGSLQGSITLEDEPADGMTTAFVIRLPLHSLAKEEIL